MSTSHLSGLEWYTTFRGPTPGPEWNSFSGPKSGPESNNFSGPGLLAVDVSPGTLWTPLFQSAHLCPPAIFSEPEWYTTFRGPNPGPEWQLFGARIQDPNGTALRGPNRTTFRGPGLLGCFSRGSLEATVSICTFVSTSHLFGARMVYDFSGPESGTRMEQLFRAQIGARIEQLFGARGSWLWCLNTLCKLDFFVFWGSKA